MKSILSIMTLFVAGALTANAQITIISSEDFLKRDTCDDIKFVINYDMKSVQDIKKTPYEYKTDRMLLEIGSKVSSFYSHDKYLADSTNLEILKRNGTEFVNSDAPSWRLYKNYPEAGHYSYLDKIMRDRYLYQEAVEEPAWMLLPDSMATIMGHSCTMAESDFLGRKWRAWYAEDIPISEGPWKLCGLPGLILRACDSENQYQFELTGIRKGRQGEHIIYTGSTHEKIDKKSLNKLYERFFDDPIAFIANAPNVKVSVYDDKGNKMSKMPAIPYNPIER
ncbi:GLPGLI family protein [Prevotella sp. OH937_COT-195]|uniref:GLPGLI family protein n=1 Tax=Prevotella sp. OH937_COT-195 TaxID=2491051 RepID=UPI000F6547DB|nr:GLPGLI family protein [Prevotella sp. OH937_COT-195]RRD00805.1 GLPGLI family protein [Prevotella sp. OH937_COT-195]